MLNHTTAGCMSWEIIYCAFKSCQRELIFIATKKMVRNRRIDIEAQPCNLEIEVGRLG